MGAFNLQDYETVDSRIKRFYGENAKGRINTALDAADRDVQTPIVDDENDDEIVQN